jgi:two-component system sensor histidine kinase/response regulator
MTASGAAPFVGRVLLVEDDAVNQRIAMMFLRKNGLVADLAADGRAAVERVQATTYDLVLMDCQLPELDGWAATRAIRSLGSTVPICALTAGSSPDDREACTAAGMNDFLAKPIQPPALVALLERWLLRAPSVTAAP